MDAAVGCRNKKGVPVVRDDACKKKEAAVDLTQFVATTTTVASTTTSSSATSSSPAMRSVPTLVRAI